MNAAVAITDPSRSTPGQFDPGTGGYGPGQPHYVAGGPEDERADWREGVPCRLQALDSDAQTLHVTQQIITRQYLLQLPADVPDVQVGHEVTVRSATNDVHLVGAVMFVIDEQHGSERFTRDLILEHNQQRTLEG
ncbi:DUF6093 family protein [Ornithinimicrobium sp. LYQ92]|uniref:DUF6093 family protein n=1 Tax=Serinicoccus sp. LYQ92 TaxID=3378798 RepID=UPI0038554AF6